MSTPAVFLDRDGTLIVDVGYLRRVEQLELFPWTVDALRLLQRAGFKLVVVTNQSGVALGLLDEPAVIAAHAALDLRLRAGGARMDGYYYCPHHPRGTVAPYASDCACRKPKAGLAERAARELDLDLDRSWVVGDRWLDMGLAAACGARGVLVRTGYGESAASEPHDGIEADAIVANLMEATGWILRHA
ncbi:MAG: HAD-IIIA family hydrolase [Luteitalea sp.]|nr:HAD-IIIA family hydrolase [Luteitalea sp.]